jgi:hypothetical protein
MFDFSYWTILRILYSLFFSTINVYFTQFLKTIESKTKCNLSSGWRISNGKLISSLLIIIGVINIFVPASKFLSTLPIIGSSYILLFVLAVFGIIFIVQRLSINIVESESSKCKIKGYDTIIDFFSTKTVMECIYFTIISSVLFFYL